MVVVVQHLIGVNSEFGLGYGRIKVGLGRDKECL